VVPDTATIEPSFDSHQHPPFHDHKQRTLSSSSSPMATGMATIEPSFDSP
jgi:hypothetical protein